jgi:acyl-coenzyme A thioesterase PaaI-like protein
MQNLLQKKMDSLKQTAYVRAFALLNVPALAWIRPSVLQMNDDELRLKVRLFRRTKNHLGTMYFGVLCMGAEAVVGFKAFDSIKRSGKKVDLIFKDFHANFLKRAEGDVEFICNEGLAIDALVQDCIKEGTRKSQSFRAIAVVPRESPDPVAEFTVTLSVKMRS